MKSIARPMIHAAVLTALCLVLVPVVMAATEELRGKVVGITDGDTITILHNRRSDKVRLNGIDAPEKSQPFGQRAKQFTSTLAFGQEVTVRVTDHDHYGRIVGDVFLSDGRNLSRELVRAGYAWWFRQYSNDRSLGELEAQARADRVGLWADPQAVPPWEWRRQHRRSTPSTATTPHR